MQLLMLPPLTVLFAVHKGLSVHLKSPHTLFQWCGWFSNSTGCAVVRRLADSELLTQTLIVCNLHHLSH